MPAELPVAEPAIERKSVRVRLVHLEPQPSGAAGERRLLGSLDQPRAEAAAGKLRRDRDRVEAGNTRARAEQHQRVAGELAVDLGDQRRGVARAEQPAEALARDAVGGEGAFLQRRERGEVRRLRLTVLSRMLLGGER